MPYSSACELLQIVAKLLESEYHVELVANVTLSLVKAHFNPIVANQNLLTIIDRVRTMALEQLTKLRDTVGYNLHGMGLMQSVIEEREGVQLFKDATRSRKQRNSKRRMKERATKRAIMTL